MKIALITHGAIRPHSSRQSSIIVVMNIGMGNLPEAPLKALDAPLNRAPPITASNRYASTNIVDIETFLFSIPIDKLSR